MNPYIMEILRKIALTAMVIAAIVVLIWMAILGSIAVGAF